MSVAPCFNSLLTEFLRYQSELGLVGLSQPISLKAIPADSQDENTSVVKSASIGKSAIKSDVGAFVQHAKAGTEIIVKNSLRSESYSSLSILSDEVESCNSCSLYKGRTSVVFGVGAKDARLMFVGDGPGRDEDLQAEPFVGPAGQLLNRMILAMGLTRESIYITNVVKCRPPLNRAPNLQELETCLPFLKEQIALVKPEVIVALGRYATQTLCQTDVSISRLRGQWQHYQGIALMPTFHPAYLLRDASKKREVWADLQAVMKRLKL